MSAISRGLAYFGCSLALLVPGSLFAQEKDATAAAIEQYREMLADGNPAELHELRGEELWKTKRGSKNVSLEQCDLGQGPGKIKGAYAQMPRYFADTGKVEDLESRLVSCMTQLQGLDRAEVTKKPYGSASYQSDMEALVAYVVGQSRGMKMAAPQKHAKEREAFALGKEIFYYRAGPFDFACSTCHGEDGKRIRLQDLPNLTQKKGAEFAYTTWPAYRVSQGELRTMQWRL
ncbi:MAG TPA: sulfur oxidation c-type cytochrome SoxA, partial [Burkholderiales bacterium]